MSEITVTLPDGSNRRVPAGTTPGEIAAGISPRLAKAALAAAVDDRLVDLSFPLQQDARVRIITPESPEGLHVYRHSTAHLLAAAVTNLFPGAQCGIGPATDEGFFYDFIVDRPFVPEDLEAIEKKMKDLAGQDLRYERQMLARDEAKQFFAGRGETLKVQLIDEKTEGQSEVSCYTIKDRDTFVDFCVGPHVPSSGRLKAFKLLNTSNAYWKGDARNQPMQRIYGTAFFSDKELQAHLQRLEEAKKRDHRKVGKEIGLFTFHAWAPGATFWLDKGTTLYNTLANYMREVLLPAGYVELKTPLIYNKALWETSGHWQHYRENMFLVTGRDGEEMGMKAMNCPGHMLVFGSEMRSYKDLPLRFHEQTPLHRNEASGVLTRSDSRPAVRAGRWALFRDARTRSHREVEALLRQVQRVYGDFGLEYEAKLSTRPAEFLGEIATWDHAEAALKQALDVVGPETHDQRRGRRVLRSEDRFRHHRCDRPQVAVRHDSARLPDPAAVRPEIHRRRQCGTPAGRYSPRDIWQFRAVHRPVDRTLRRCLPALAGAGAGGGAADRGPSLRLRAERRSAARSCGVEGGVRRTAGKDRL